MTAAGQAAFDQLKIQWPQARSVAVFCGKGKNAGDGYILARLAHQSGLAVTVYALAPLDSLPLVSQHAAQAAIKAGVLIQSSEFADCTAEVMVDAIFGSGLRGEVSGLFAEVIQAIN